MITALPTIITQHLPLLAILMCVPATPLCLFILSSDDIILLGGGGPTDSSLSRVAIDSCRALACCSRTSRFRASLWGSCEGGTTEVLLLQRFHSVSRDMPKAFRAAESWGEVEGGGELDPCLVLLPLPAAVEPLSSLRRYLT